MTKKAIFATAMILVVCPLFASPRFPSGPAGPLLPLPAPPVFTLPPGIGPTLPLTPERIRQLPLSPSAMHALLAGFAQPVSTSNAVTMSSSAGAGGHGQQGRLAVRTLTSVLNPLQMDCCNDDGREQEPTITTNFVGGENIFSAFMKYAFCCPAAGVRIYATSPATPSGIMIPTDYDSSGDPILAVNDHNGIAPQRVYLIGADFHYNPYEPNPTKRLPSQVVVWQTDGNGSIGWNTRHILRLDTYIPGLVSYFNDKPSIAVSAWSRTQGYVYAVFARVALDASDINANPNQLLVYRSGDGGATWAFTATLSQQFSSPGNPTLPSATPTCFSVVVSPYTGDVFIFWLDWGTNMIYGARSDFAATYFTLLPSFYAGKLLGNTGDFLTDGGVTVEARSMINVRYNWHVGRIGVVFHRRESETDEHHSDVYLATYDGYGSYWSGPTRVNDVQVGYSADQWNPALDFDDWGEWLVTFYDRRNDQAQSSANYRLAVTKFNYDGTIKIDATDTIATYTSFSDPTKTVPVNGLEGIYYTLGEYQDAWYSNGRLIAATVYAPITITNYDDIWYSYIAP